MTKFDMYINIRENSIFYETIMIEHVQLTPGRASSLTPSSLQQKAKSGKNDICLKKNPLYCCCFE